MSKNPYSSVFYATQRRFIKSSSYADKM